MPDTPLLLASLVSAMIGALIGGTTNFLAIRMLFRPHRRWTILGFRVPMTPGMIPNRQAELAANVARTVSEHLIPAEELLKSVDTPEFKAAISRSIHRNLMETMNSRIGETVRIFGGDWDRIVDIVCDHLQVNLIEVADTPEVRRALEAMSRRQAERIADHLSRKLPPSLFSPLRSVFEKRFEPIIRQAVAAALHDCLKSPPTITTAIEELRPRIEEQVKNARPAEYIPERAIASLAETITGRVMEFVRQDAEHIFANLDIRSIIEERICSFPSEKIEKLTIDCARRQLVAITFIGFVLGAIVGSLNPLIYFYLKP